MPGPHSLEIMIHMVWSRTQALEYFTIHPGHSEAHLGSGPSYFTEEETKAQKGVVRRSQATRSRIA